MSNQVIQNQTIILTKFNSYCDLLLQEVNNPKPCIDIQKCLSNITTYFNYLQDKNECSDKFNKLFNELFKLNINGDKTSYLNKIKELYDKINKSKPSSNNIPFNDIITAINKVHRNKTQYISTSYKSIVSGGSNTNKVVSKTEVQGEVPTEEEADLEQDPNLIDFYPDDFKVVLDILNTLFNNIENIYDTKMKYLVTNMKVYILELKIIYK